MSRRLTIAAGIAAAAVILPWLAAGPARATVLAAYLAAWWCCMGVIMGGLANVWMHNLTGGPWGEAIRAPLLQLSKPTWILALLFLPVLLGVAELYPWAGPGGSDWARDLPPHEAVFKLAWLSPAFFILRSVAYLALWVVLARLSVLPHFTRSRHFSAIALMAYCVSMSLAAVDWIMSLMPIWYSSVFGLLWGMGQMLAGMAAAVLFLALRQPASLRVSASPRDPPLLRDLGNLLLTYVLTWAYLEFTQFLIIWAADLPHEIAWYVPRVQTQWAALAVLLALAHFALPVMVLLFRDFKQSARCMAALAAGLLLLRLAYAWWSIFPSLQLPEHWALRALPETAGLVCLAVIVAIFTLRQSMDTRHV